MDSLVGLWLSILVILGGTGLGRLARGLKRREDESLDERLLLDTAIGLGILSLLIFVCASLRLFASKWVTIAFHAPALLGLAVVVPEIAAAAPALISRKRSRSGVLCGLLLLILALAALIPALAPPSMSDWDSLAYHLAVPKLWVEHGGFYYIDFASHSNFPSLTEMLYVPGLHFHQPVAAKMVHYWMGILLVAAVALLARKHFGAGSAWMAAIAIAGMPIVLWEATTAYIDLATALYTVVTVHLLLNYLDTPRTYSLIWFAVAAGFAASTKMTGLAVIPLVAIWITAGPASDPSTGSGCTPRTRWKAAAVFVVVSLLVCSPWYVKSYIYTGNPVYPFFYSIFGGKDWTSELASNYSMLQARFGIGHSIAAFLTLPYDLTFRPDAFYDTPGLYVGPLFLIAVPILLFGRGISRKYAGLLAFLLARVAIWFVLTQQSRYLIPAAAVLAVLVASRGSRVIGRGSWVVALWVVLAATALFGLWTLYPAIRSGAPVVFGSENADRYLSRTLDIYPARKFMNDNLPPNSKVALYGDTRGFYLDRPYVWADPGHNARFTRNYPDLDAFVRYLRSQGITHAMVNFRFFPPANEARGTARLVYEAIASGRFERIYPLESDRGTVGVFVILNNHNAENPSPAELGLGQSWALHCSVFHASARRHGVYYK